MSILSRLAGLFQGNRPSTPPEPSTPLKATPMGWVEIPEKIIETGYRFSGNRDFYVNEVIEHGSIIVLVVDRDYLVRLDRESFFEALSKGGEVSKKERADKIRRNFDRMREGLKNG